jgi:hypothetical protein
MSKLHGLERRERKRVTVDIPPAVVTNPTGSTLALGDYSGWGHTQAWEVFHFRVREDNPLTFIDHIDKFFGKEGKIVGA